VAGARGCLDNWFVVNLLHFIGCYMKQLLTVVLTVVFGAICFNIGKQSVETHVIIPMCQETKLKLIASRISNEEIVCVYLESWQIKGKPQRTINAIQKKTT